MQPSVTVDSMVARSQGAKDGSLREGNYGRDSNLSQPADIYIENTKEINMESPTLSQPLPKINNKETENVWGFEYGC